MSIDPTNETAQQDVPHEEAQAERLFERMVATQEHLNALIAQIQRAVAAAVMEGRVEAPVFDPLLAQYRQASRAATGAFTAWQQAGFPGLVLATEADAIASAVPAAPNSQLPSARLQFAKWLYQQGRLSG
ncbi:MAG TPA: hypothetical protein VGW38_29625 [Chloroflexota bacterium]|nr:hypothetical protein [Chloroflexota bacterium]